MKSETTHDARRGFSLLELLFIASIIGILSSIAILALSEAREKSHDAKRIGDLNEIRAALLLHYELTGNFVGEDSGCGDGGAGDGWFNHDPSTSAPKPIAQCLIDSGALPEQIIDPSGDTQTSQGGGGLYSDGNAYAKFTCKKGVDTKPSGDTYDATVTYVCAVLEGEPQSTTYLNDTCQPDYDEDSWGMNYCVTLP